MDSFGKDADAVVPTATAVEMVAALVFACGAVRDNSSLAVTSSVLASNDDTSASSGADYVACFSSRGALVSSLMANALSPYSFSDACVSFVLGVKRVRDEKDNEFKHLHFPLPRSCCFVCSYIVALAANDAILTDGSTTVFQLLLRLLSQLSWL